MLHSSRVLALRSLLPLVLVATVACAKLTHQTVTDFADPGGIPYYEGSHYLLVYSDGKGGVVWKLLFLADPNKKRVAKPTAILANLDTTLAFSGGVLGQSKAVGDSTAVPRAVIQAIEKVAGSLAPANADATRPHQIPKPSLYRVTWTGKTLTFVGGPATDPISVTLSGADE